jgi:hypothetical protein
MTKNRTITSIVIVLAAVAASPGAAAANPLLSGYGGPGQGSQTILGSALLNGPRNGSGGSAGGGAAPSTATNASEASTVPGGAASNGASGASNRASRASNRASRASQRARTRATATEPAPGSPVEVGAPSTAGAPGLYPASTQGGTAPAWQAAGLSVEDLELVILVLGALACTGVVTRRLAWTARGEARGGSSNEPQKPSH